MRDFKLQQCSVVVSYQREPKIRYHLEKVESAFSGMMGTNASTIDSAVDSDPVTARFVFQKGHKRLAVSQTAAQFELDFSSSDKDSSERLSILEKNVNNFWDAFAVFKPYADVASLGQIFVFRQMLDYDPLKVSSELMSHFSKVPHFGDPASFSIVSGYLHASKNFYINLSISSYEIRELTIDGGFPGSHIIEMDTVKLKEFGKEVRIDVNNRPSHKNGAVACENSMSSLYIVAKEAIDKCGEDLFGATNVL